MPNDPEPAPYGSTGPAPAGGGAPPLPWTEPEPRRADLAPPTVGATGAGASLSEPQAPPDQTPEQIDPGLDSGLRGKPQMPR